jgi:(p)ppGpp synthase/HD superfamily hydrolase
MPPNKSKEQLINKLRTIGLEDNKEIECAMEIAEITHQNQVRDGGEPYLDQHIYPIVCRIISKYPNNSELKFLIIVALLHDVVEKSRLNYKKILKKLGKRIAEAVLILTKEKRPINSSDKSLIQQNKYNDNERYLKKVGKSDQNIILVKLEDRLNNLQSIVDKDVINAKKAKYIRYIKESEELYFPLIEASEFNFDYKSVYEKEIKRIRKELGNTL